MDATSTAQLAHALDPATQQLSVRAVIPEADLQRWSPSAPALYNATLTLLSSSAPGSLPAATDSACPGDAATAVTWASLLRCEAAAATWGGEGEWRVVIGRVLRELEVMNH